MKLSAKRNFTDREIETWRQLFNRQSPLRAKQVHSRFLEGLQALQMTPDRIPDVDDVNRILKDKTGWRAVLVEGLEDAQGFYEMLSKRMFPIGNFIRDPKDLSYTPEPDIFHDLYGHMPFYVHPDYGDFCQEYGAATMRYAHNENQVRQFERFFWFTIEFGLINTPQGKRIFGGGIASSFGECAYSLSDEPNIVDFDIDTLRKQEFRIDIMQKRLFLLESEEQLFSSLAKLEDAISSDPNPNVIPIYGEVA